MVMPINQQFEKSGEKLFPRSLIGSVVGVLAVLATFGLPQKRLFSETKHVHLVTHT